jgi:hypothetical protein
MKHFQSEVESMTEFIDGTDKRETFPKSYEMVRSDFREEKSRVLD